MITFADPEVKSLCVSTWGGTVNSKGIRGYLNEVTPAQAQSASDAVNPFQGNTAITTFEASELNEAFLWKDAKDVNIDKVKEELADIVNYAILIADKYDLDINQIVLDKLKRNAEKYPVDKAYGSAKKYNEL